MTVTSDEENDSDEVIPVQGFIYRFMGAGISVSHGEIASLCLVCQRVGLFVWYTGKVFSTMKYPVYDG